MRPSSFGVSLLALAFLAPSTIGAGPPVAKVGLLATVLGADPTPTQTVWPSPGKFVGVIQNDTAGKWIILSSDLMPVQSQVRDVGKLCFFEGLPGRYAVILILGGDAQPIVSTVTLGGGPPIPPPTPDPTPGPLTERARQIQEKSLAVTGDPKRGETARGLAELYRQIAKLIRAGTVKDVHSLITAMKVAADQFLTTRGSGVAAAWQPVRDLIGTQVTTLQAKNAPLSDYAVLLDDVSTGLDAFQTVLKRDGISPELMALIMQIIQFILTFLK